MTGSSPFRLVDASLGDGTVVLEASAGTGKTYTLTGIVLRLLLEQQVTRLDQVLVVTFTIAATDELKTRLRRALRDALAVLDGAPTDDDFLASLRRHGEQGRRRLREALDQFDQLGVQTIHGFCKRLLDDAAFESHEPFEVDFATDELPLWHRAAADALRRVRTFDGPVLADLLRIAELDPDTLIAAYRAWQRYPAVALDPAAPDLAGAMRRCEQAVLTAASQWTDAAGEWLLRAKLYADCRTMPDDPGQRTLFVNELRARLTDDPLRAAGTLRQLSKSALPSSVQKNSLKSLAHPFFDACEPVTAAADEAAEHLRSHLLLDMHARLDAQKRADRVMTFQDLLERAHAALHDPARAKALLDALRDRYHVGLIDEFQDTDALQYRIFERIFEHRPLFLIGDPKQSIYGFRGADLDTYAYAKSNAVATPTLPTNHRSAKALVAAVGHLFSRPDAFVLPDLRLPAVQAAAGEHDLLLAGDDAPPLRWRLLPPPPWGDALWARDAGREAIAVDVADEIQRLLATEVRLDRRRLRPGDIAVLTRLNVEATLVQGVLRQRGVHAVIGKAGDVFDTDERQELERLMRAVLQPNDLQLARAAMATRLWGLAADQLRHLEGDASAFDEQLARLESWRQLWTRSGFFVMQERLLDELGTTARLLEQTGGERRLTNLQQLAEMLHTAEHEHRLSPEGLLRWLVHETQQRDETDYQRRELRLESDVDAVQILTMHGSKGLQYEVVFCPFLWDGRMPGNQNLVVGDGDRGRRFLAAADSKDPTILAADRSRLAEDVRLLYVAVTRAKRRCYLHWGPIAKNAGFHRSALGWLLPPFPDHDRWPLAAKDLAPRLEADLRAFAAAGDATMDVTLLDGKALTSRRPPPPAPTSATPPAPTSAPRSLPSRRATGLFSFTSLVANRPVEASARDVRDPSRAVDEGPGRGIFGFARGAEAGVCLHEILEHTTLDRLDDAAAERVAATLTAHGLLEAEAHPGDVAPVADVMQNLRDLAAATAGPGGPDLATLTRGARSAEWPFAFPLAATDLRRLAAAFAADGSDLTRAYAKRLTQLPARTLHGFVNGIADLIAEHDGRFWLLDWKSNHLGDTGVSYDAAALRASMIEHDYVLQYHLYVLALHRHLAARLPGYRYEQHFGGVLYVYLRGAEAGSDRGVFHDRPPAALVAAMDAWAGGNRDSRQRP